MNVEVKKLPRGQAEVVIELTEAEYEPFLKKAAQQISEQTKVPGFRPGKADYELIKKRVGEQEIWQTALELAIYKTLPAALDSQKLDTVGQPHVDVVKLAPGNPVVYKCVVSLLPEMTLGEYASLKVEKKKPEVPETEIEKSLFNLQKMRSTKKEIDRPAQKTDEVTIDFKTFLDKVPLENGSHTGYVLAIGEGVFIPGFEDQLIGMKKGDDKTFRLQFPKDYYQKHLAGKDVDFEVKMNEIKEVVLPELNDAFAAQAGAFKSLDELKGKIRENLQHEQEHKEDHRFEEEIIDKLIAQTKFGDIADVLIDSETKKMMEELKQNIAMQGIKFEDYLSHLKKTEAELALELTPQAIKRVKSALIIREIGKREHITVTDAEIDHDIQNILVQYGGNPEVEKQLNEPSYRQYLGNIIASRKTMDFLKSKVVQ